MGESKDNGMGNAALDGVAIFIFFILIGLFWFIVFWLTKLIFSTTGIIANIIMVCIISFLFYIFLPEDYKTLLTIVSFATGIICAFLNEN